MSPVYTYIYHPIEEKERREITFSVLGIGWEIVCFFWRRKSLDDFVYQKGGGVNEELDKESSGGKLFITWPQFL